MDDVSLIEKETDILKLINIALRNLSHLHNNGFSEDKYLSSAINALQRVKELTEIKFEAKKVVF
jgi:hypothetical protein